MKLSKSTVTALGLFALATTFSSAANAHDIDSMACLGNNGSQAAAQNIEKAQKFLDDNYTQSFNARAGEGGFSIFKHKANPEDSIVVSSFDNGKICFAPIPLEMMSALRP